MKKLSILLLPVISIGFWAIVWMIGNNNPVPSSHAMLFLIHSSGAWYSPVVIAAIGMLIITTVGTIGSWFAVMYQKYIWVVCIALVFMVAAALAYTREAAGGSNRNITFRYNQYRVEKGWDK